MESIFHLEYDVYSVFPILAPLHTAGQAKHYGIIN